MRDHDTVSYFDVLDAITDGKYFPSSLVPDNARKLRLDRVEPAGNEQVAIIDGRVLNANEHLTRFGSPGSAISTRRRPSSGLPYFVNWMACISVFLS